MPNSARLAADRIDQLCPLADQHLSDAMENQDFLLHLFLDRNEPHLGRVTASQIASASAASFLLVLT
ncbi:hypothetical protein AB3480_34850 [Rhizobium mongolense]|uniref:hypothetical protein n=1 Tax=Rhizobium mongolense TaxID=57676 RepID=UPI0034A223F2